MSAIRVLHPFPSLVVTAVTVTFAFLADSSPPTDKVTALGIGMLCYQFCIGLVNDIVDASDDAVSKPWKAIPRGVVPRRAALLLAAFLASAGLFATSTLPTAGWLIGVGGLGCGLAYDLWLKRTPLSWLPMSLALPLIPVWIFVALDRWDALLWWSLPLGWLLGLSLHLVNQAPDIAAEADIRGFAHRLGPGRSKNLGLRLFIVAFCAAAIVLFVDGSPWHAAVVAAAGALGAAVSRRATELFGRDGLFGVLAAASAALAVAFVSAAG